MPSASRRPERPTESPSDLIYAAILKEAAPVAEMPLALDAELAVSALLGGVYAATDLGRIEAVRQFAADFNRYLADQHGPEAGAVRAALTALLPDTARESPKPGAPEAESRKAGAGRTGARKTGRTAKPDDAAAPDSPSWAPAAGEVTCTGTWAITDNYGDQTQYVAGFAYRDADRGGPEHAMSYLLDHNLGIVKSLSVGVPAERVVDGWREAAAEDPDITIEDVPGGKLRADVTAYLARTDELEKPPDDTYVEQRTFAGSRLDLLPDDGVSSRPTLSDAARDIVVTEFLQSPEGSLSTSTGAPPVSVISWGARAAVDFAVDDNTGDPLRWSPTAVELMLLDWAPREVSRGHEAGPWLPEVLDAFVSYAGRIRGQSESAVAATRDAVTDAAVRYTDLMTGDTLGEPVTDVLARMVADGVDPLNDEEVLEWVLADRARRERD